MTEWVVMAPRSTLVLHRSFAFGSFALFCVCTSSARAQDPSAQTSATAPTSAPAAPVVDAPQEPAVEVPESGVPSDLATAQWNVLPDDAALPTTETSVAPEPSDNELTISGRVMAGFQVRDRRPADGQPGSPGTTSGSAGTDYGFVLRQARLRAELRPNKRLRIVVSADFSDALDPTDFAPPPYLRNAYLEFAIEKRWLEIRVGRFKRPYSRIELRSVAALPFVGRGLTNDWIVEQEQWGDRAVGAMLSGRVEAARLRWWLSATNAAWQTSRTPDGVDLLARLEWDVNDLLEVGGGGGAKWIEDASGELGHVLAGGLDARLRYEGLEVMGEMLLAQRASVPNQPLSMGVVGAASYAAPVSKNVRLQPTLFGEWTDADIEFSGDDALRLALGMNVLWKKSFRVMPQFELIRPLGTVTERNSWVATDRFTLIFSGQM